jgi:hypothetical protein
MVRGMRHRLEHDDELRRQLQRQDGLFARRQLPHPASLVSAESDSFKSIPELRTPA